MKDLKPMEIEQRSFEIITEELGDRRIDPETAPILKRVIHTSADFDYAENLVFCEGAVQAGLRAIREGCTIVTDTNMALSGINKPTLFKSGGRALCFMAEADVAEEAKKRETTRAAVAMEKAAKLAGPLILAVGNAPTALIKLRELLDKGEIRPDLIIAVPVGFVNVVESKELIVEAGVPAIVARGRKGGSNVAAAIVNALLYMAYPRD